MSLFLGLDAGGTKTDYVLADDTKILARVRTGTIKRMRADAATAERNLEEGLAKLTAETGMSMRSVTRTCIGTAGERVPLVVDWLRAQFSERVAGELLVIGDVEIALDAAFAGSSGVLILAGTGSNVAGRTQQQALLNAGGWGPALADQGSGHRIGHEGLRAAFYAIDEEEPSTLLDAVMEFWKLRSPDEVVAFSNRIPSPDFSQLTQLIVQSAQQGDAVARRVLAREGTELARLAALVVRRVQRAAGADVEENGGANGWVPPVAFAGSILEKIPLVREAVVAELTRQFPGVQILPGVVDPIDGAIWRARGGVKSTPGQLS